MNDVSPILVHFYRATVLHADVWRQRLDATTNWAVVASAAIITFSFSEVTNPHFMLLLAGVFAIFFLTMESRRYQTFNLWRHRVRVLNRYVVAPALAPEAAPPPDTLNDELAALATELGSTKPHISMADALGYRLRRNYGYLFGAILGAWVLKLWYHPTQTATLVEFIHRAEIGPIPGKQVFSGVIALVCVGVFLAIRARSEHMEEWEELPSPLRRMLRLKETTREMSFSADQGLRQEPLPIRRRLMRGVAGRLPTPEDVDDDLIDGD